MHEEDCFNSFLFCFCRWPGPPTLTALTFTMTAMRALPSAGHVASARGCAGRGAGTDSYVASDVSEIKILPLRMIGVGAKMAPLPDPAKRSADDPQLFTGSLWIMVRGSWKVQIEVTGQKGVAQLDVPLPAVSTSSQPMHAGLGILLAFLGLALAAGLIGIIFAATRDAALNAGERPGTVTGAAADASA